MKSSFIHKPALHILMLIAFGLIAYSNTYNVPVILDDHNVIVDNPITHNLHYFVNPSDAQQFDRLFEYNTFKKRYIGYLTFALNYKFHGLDVTGYHIVNILVHIINSLLIYFFLILTFQTPILKRSYLKARYRQIALISALLFVSHPIQTQAITYIWQRVTSLATMFYMLAFVMYVKARVSNNGERAGQGLEDRFFTGRRLLFYAVALVSTVCAMKTKEIAFMLPVTVTLYEFMFLKGDVKKRIVYLLPLLLTMLIIPLSLIDFNVPIGELFGKTSDKLVGDSVLSRWEYLFTEFSVILTYLRLLVLPFNLNLDYDYPVYRNFMDMDVFIPFMLLTLIFMLNLYLLYYYRKISPHIRIISFGVFWFFINLALESTIIPLSNVIYEHRLYLPSIGPFFAISTSLFIIWVKFESKWSWSNKVFVILIASIILILTGGTYGRNKVWKSQISLWEDVVSKSPNKARGHNNLGNAYISEGLIDKAIQQYEMAIGLRPVLAEVPYNLGNAYIKKGLIDKAIQQYEMTIRLAPDYANAHHDLGNAYIKKGLIDKAIQQFEIAIKLNPDFTDPHYNLGNAYMEKGFIDEAIKQFEIAIRLNPQFSDAYNNLGSVHLGLDHIDEAIHNFENALAFNPENKAASFNLRIARAIKAFSTKQQNTINLQ